MTAYEIVKASRDIKRPTGIKYIDALTSGFIEMHGDRKFSDDKSIIGGIGYIGNRPITVIAIEKGADTGQKIMRNFGCANPEGYRKALRLMEQAEKFHRPVLCLVDTSGAYCGIGAEERGQAQAIADNLLKMMSLKTPILSIVIGEGGSGGALGLAVSDEVWITETATYSVISPEGCASILWKDSAKVVEAAESLKMTANDLITLRAVDKVLEEREFGISFFDSLKQQIVKFFNVKCEVETGKLLEDRYNRFRKF